MNAPIPVLTPSQTEAILLAMIVPNPLTSAQIFNRWLDLFPEQIPHRTLCATLNFMVERKFIAIKPRGLRGQWIVYYAVTNAGIESLSRFQEQAEAVSRGLQAVIALQTPPINCQG